jgi:hypothetical protein
LISLPFSYVIEDAKTTYGIKPFQFQVYWYRVPLENGFSAETNPTTSPSAMVTNDPHRSSFSQDDSGEMP